MDRLVASWEAKCEESKEGNKTSGIIKNSEKPSEMAKKTKKSKINASKDKDASEIERERGRRLMGERVSV